jgi:hypothetical protein
VKPCRSAPERPRVRRLHDLRLDLEERKEIVEIERLSRDLREAQQQIFEQVAQAAERPGENVRSPIENSPCSVRQTMYA